MLAWAKPSDAEKIFKFMVDNFNDNLSKVERGLKRVYDVSIDAKENIDKALEDLNQALKNSVIEVKIEVDA